MAKSTAKPQVEGTSIQADIAEGKALSVIWKNKEKAAKAAFSKDTKADGFDTRLGNLLLKLQSASSMDNGQISRQVLTTYNLDKIDRRRRSEALWFVKNQAEATDFIQASKKGFTSLTALQAAMRKAAKGSEDQPAKAEPSNVGQSEPTEQPKAERPKITQSVMVNTIVQQAHLNNLDLEEIVLDLMAVLENRQKGNAKAAA